MDKLKIVNFKMENKYIDFLLKFNFYYLKI